MALYRLEFLISSDVDVTSGTTTVTLNDGQDVSSVVPGAAVFINNQVVEAISGQNISPTQSTITLRYNWPFATVTAGRLVAFNTFEGLNTAITRLNDVIGSIPDFTGATGQGFLYNNGSDTYSIKPSTIFGESLLTAADASSALSILQSPDYPSFTGQAGIIKKDALDVYSIATSTAFGESLLSQVDAATARATLGITDPSTFGQTLITQPDATSARAALEVVSATEAVEGLIRKQTQAEALAGTDDSGSMSSLRVHESFQQYGLGSSDLSNIADFKVSNKSGFYGFTSGAIDRPNFTNGMLICGTPDANGRDVQIAISTVGGEYAHRFVNNNVSTEWYYSHTTYNLIDAQNLSGATVSPNGTVPGSGLNPSQSGTWRNVCGSDVLDNGYGLFRRV